MGQLDIASMQRNVSSMLISKIGLMDLSDLQNVSAAMIGRIMHENKNSKAVDALVEFIAQVQTIIREKKEKKA